MMSDFASQAVQFEPDHRHQRHRLPLVFITSYRIEHATRRPQRLRLQYAAAYMAEAGR